MNEQNNDNLSVKKEQLQKPRQSYAFEMTQVLAVALEMGFIIALPITLFAILGKWLDSKYQTKYFVFIGIVLAIILSSVWLYKRFAEMLIKLRNAAETKNPRNQSGKQ